MKILSVTIKQAADELGVSKTAIRKYLTEDFKAQYVETTANHTLMITAEGMQKLQTFGIGLRKLPQTFGNLQAETTANQVSAEIVAFLKAQLEEKDRQIATLQSQNGNLQEQLKQQSEELSAERQHSREEVEKLTAALTAAQALHAADKQQQLLLEEKSQSSFLKKFVSFFRKDNDLE